MRQWWDFEVTLYSYACIKHETQRTTRILYVLHIMFSFFLYGITFKQQHQWICQIEKIHDEFCASKAHAEQKYTVNNIRPYYRRQTEDISRFVKSMTSIHLNPVQTKNFVTIIFRRRESNFFFQIIEPFRVLKSQWCAILLDTSFDVVELFRKKRISKWIIVFWKTKTCDFGVLYLVLSLNISI